MCKFMKHLRKNKWYHGTTLESWKKLCANKVQYDYNLGNELDFGAGFYLTQKEDQAKKFITDLLIRKEDDDQNLNEIFQENNAGFIVREDKDDRVGVVIEFDFCPEPFYTDDDCDFKILSKYDDEFAEFVFHNRLNNVNGENQHCHDLIYGGMSDSLPFRLIADFKSKKIERATVIEGLKKSTSNTQLSIHNQDICDKLIVSRAYIIESGKELDVNEYNPIRHEKC